MGEMLGLWCSRHSYPAIEGAICEGEVAETRAWMAVGRGKGGPIFGKHFQSRKRMENEKGKEPNAERNKEKGEWKATPKLASM